MPRFQPGFVSRSRGPGDSGIASDLADDVGTGDSSDSGSGSTAGALGALGTAFGNVAKALTPTGSTTSTTPMGTLPTLPAPKTSTAAGTAPSSGLSTTAMVGIGVGVLALVGLAFVATRKNPSRRRRRRPLARRSHRRGRR
jgi:hypothetical protein